MLVHIAGVLDIDYEYAALAPLIDPIPPTLMYLLQHFVEVVIRQGVTAALP